MRLFKRKRRGIIYGSMEVNDTRNGNCFRYTLRPCIEVVEIERVGEKSRIRVTDISGNGDVPKYQVREGVQEWMPTAVIEWLD